MSVCFKMVVMASGTFGFGVRCPHVPRKHFSGVIFGHWFNWCPTMLAGRASLLLFAGEKALHPMLHCALTMYSNFGGSTPPVSQRAPDHM